MGTGIRYFFPGFILHGGAPQRQRQCGLNERDQAGIVLTERPIRQPIFWDP